MDKYTTQSEATQMLAAELTHDDLQPGPGVIPIPTHAEIARRAYEIYIKTGRIQGQCKQNWQHAEHDLRTGTCRGY